MNLLRLTIDCDENHPYLTKKSKLNPKIVHFKLEPKLKCKPYENPDLFIYVFNRIKNVRKRLAIRKTWGNKFLFPKVKLAFILGMSEDEKLNEMIRRENEKFNDIIQGTFIVN